MGKDIKNQIEEFLKMGPGEKIPDPDLKISISDKAQFTRRSLKHFVESRLKAGNSLSEIYYLIDKSAEVVLDPHLNIANSNKTYPDSSLMGRFYDEVDKAVMLVLDKGDSMRDIISLHFKNREDFYELLKGN